MLGFYYSNAKVSCNVIMSFYMEFSIISAVCDAVHGMFGVHVQCNHSNTYCCLACRKCYCLSASSLTVMFTTVTELDFGSCVRCVHIRTMSLQLVFDAFRNYLPELVSSRLAGCSLSWMSACWVGLSVFTHPYCAAMKRKVAFQTLHSVSVNKP